MSKWFSLITFTKEILFSLCLFILWLAELLKYYWLDLPEKNSEDVSWFNLDSH